jgi:predicted amidohydrolase
MSGKHGSTLYNSLLYLDSHGQLLGTHRKLMPTGPERMVWGQGDGSSLLVFDPPFGRLGGLICWENYMPLARAAMYAQGLDILLAPTWDRGETWVARLRHIGKEGRVCVVGVGTCMRGSDVPAGIEGRDSLYGGDDDWLDDGCRLSSTTRVRSSLGRSSRSRASSMRISTSRRRALPERSSTRSGTTRVPTYSRYA